MRFLRNDCHSKSERNRRLAMPIGDAIDEKCIRAVVAKRCSPADSIPELLKKISILPVLVIENMNKRPILVGIVAPFDLL